MHPLHDLPLDELTPTRLWATLDRLTRALAARALFDGDLRRATKPTTPSRSRSDFGTPVFATSRWIGGSTTSRASCALTMHWPRRC